MWVREDHDRVLFVCSRLKRRRAFEVNEDCAWCLGDVLGMLVGSCAAESSKVGVSVRCGLSACDLLHTEGV